MSKKISELEILNRASEKALIPIVESGGNYAVQAGSLRADSSENKHLLEVGSASPLSIKTSDDTKFLEFIKLKGKKELFVQGDFFIGEGFEVEDIYLEDGACLKIDSEEIINLGSLNGSSMGDSSVEVLSKKAQLKAPKGIRNLNINAKDGHINFLEIGEILNSTVIAEKIEFSKNISILNTDLIGDKEIIVKKGLIANSSAISEKEIYMKDSVILNSNIDAENLHIINSNIEKTVIVGVIITVSKSNIKTSDLTLKESDTLYSKMKLEESSVLAESHVTTESSLRSIDYIIVVENSTFKENSMELFFLISEKEHGDIFLFSSSTRALIKDNHIEARAAKALPFNAVDVSHFTFKGNRIGLGMFSGNYFGKKARVVIDEGFADVSKNAFFGMGLDEEHFIIEMSGDGMKILENNLGVIENIVE